MRTILVRSKISRLFALASLLALAARGVSGFAAEPQEDPDPWVPVGFLIISSSASYSEARQVVDEAGNRLGMPVNLRGLVYDPKFGLTLPKEECAKDPLFPFPCYVARGRFDAGTYLSIERSDAYATFRPGYFIVIAASGSPDAPELTSTLERVHAAYPDAYLKKEKVYHGCMH